MEFMSRMFFVSSRMIFYDLAGTDTCKSIYTVIILKLHSLNTVLALIIIKLYACHENAPVRVQTEILKL